MKARLSLLLVPVLATGCSLDFDKYLEENAQADVKFVSDAATDATTHSDAAGGGGSDALPPDAAPMDDQDGDGVPDGTDNCPMVANPGQEDGDHDGQGDACDGDTDGDGVADAMDDCPTVANPDQSDLDHDGQGDACDDDADGDTLNAAAEMAKGTDPLRADTDGDGHEDAEDKCPLAADRVDHDGDGDGQGDACDADDDGDGVPDWRDTCPGTVNADQAAATCAADLDGDGVANEQDNCPTLANPDQAVVPCHSPFQAITYSRDVHGMAVAGDALFAGTSGGLVQASGDDLHVLTTADGLGGNRIDGVATDADGRVWAATDRGLVVRRPDGFTFTLHANDAGGGPQGHLRDVAVDPAGTVWVSSDAGLNKLDMGGWTLLGAGMLPSVDVRGLHVDAMGRLWAATAMGVVRIAGGAVEATLSGFQGIGDAFLSVSEDADGTVWLLAEGGAVAVGPDGMPMPGLLFTGFQARDLAGNPGGRLVATEAGLRRVDTVGRMFPPGAALLPSPDVRALAAAPGGATWVGTAGGLLALDGYFATWRPGGANAFMPPCATTATRIGDDLWIGTDDGVVRMGRDGTVTPVGGDMLPGGAVSVIRPIGNEVWVGTASGIGIFAPDGTFQQRVVAADGIPGGAITDIVAGRNDDVWVASNGTGIARRNIERQWTTYTAETVGANFLHNEVRALAHDGNFLWAATPLGLIVYDEEARQFATPITTNLSRLPDPRVQDVVVANGKVYAGTGGGVAIRSADGQWSTLRRTLGGWPQDAGSDFVKSLAHDGTHLWILLAGSRPQPDGVLVRRLGDEPVADGADFASKVALFNATNAGIAPSGGQGQASLELAGRELFLSVCGDMNQPGGLSVLDGPGVVTADLTPRLGLPGDGQGAHLTRDLDGRPLFAAPGAAHPDLIRIGDDASLSVFDRQNLDVLPVACDAADGGDLWCALAGTGIGHRLENGQWLVLGPDRIPAFMGADIRDIAVESNDSVWVATSKGVMRLSMGSVRSFNKAGTSNGLPDDDVRQVIVDANHHLYAATAGGVGILDAAANTWTKLTPDEGLKSEALALALAPDGSLWIGTAAGLYHRDGSGVLTAYDAGNGLPMNRVTSLAVLGDGRVLVGTPAGLAIGTPGDPMQFQILGLADGLPGEAVYDIQLAGAGEVWIRSDDGVARLTPP
jgi:ligand-binding sensor domain-containing protein